MLVFGIWMMAVFVEGPFVEGSFQDILVKAKAENKLIFVDVYTDWCGPCKLLDRTTWKDPGVQTTLSEKVISIKVNAEEGDGIAFAKKYSVRGYPSLLVIDSNGELRDRYTGYLNPRGFLVWLAKNFDE